MTERLSSGDASPEDDKKCEVLIEAWRENDWVPGSKITHKDGDSLTPKGAYLVAARNRAIFKKERKHLRAIVVSAGSLRGRGVPSCR